MVAQDVYGLASGTEVASAGLQIVERGGTATNTIVNSDGTLELLGGAFASDFSIKFTWHSGNRLRVLPQRLRSQRQHRLWQWLRAARQRHDRFRRRHIRVAGWCHCKWIRRQLGRTVEIASGYLISGYEVATGVTLEVANGGTALDVVVDNGASLELLAVRSRAGLP